ncbi:MAG: hypothetical protein ACJA2O_000079 [Candidatus Azotimanducaceae bacterium]|jgi:hypothetical protein
MVMDANGEIIQVDDGGIYRLTSPLTNTGDWFSMNGNLQVSEQHDIAYDSVSNIIISGTQDNGTTEQSTSGNLIWNEIGGGDGGDVAVDTTTALPNSIRYSSSQNNQGLARLEYDSTNVLVKFDTLALSGSGIWAANFVTPTELNAVTQSRIVFGGANGILESLDKGDNVTYLITDSINEGALAYGANGNAEALYAGADNVVLARVSGSAAPLATATAYPGSIIKDIIIKPTDENTIYVIEATKVYTTTDAGSTWTEITGNLVNTDLRSVEYVSGATDSLAVSGLGGVFRMDTSQPSVWTMFGSGLPTVPIYDLEYDPTDNVMVAGTLGRGAWLLTNANANTTSTVDTDGDGVADSSDNCPNTANTDQLNTDSDSAGNLCDADDDGDGTADTSDTFPLDSTETLDTDSDGIGNNADTDDDGDGILDTSDSFPLDATNTPPNRLQNLASRGFVGTGDNVLIGGLVIRGTRAKTVVIRARGPALTSAGVAGALTNPQLTLFSGADIIDSNDDWEVHDNVNLIPTNLRPTDAAEAVIAITLNPGAYTAIMSGVGDEEGVGLIEIFEIDDTGETRLQNIATRSFVGTGDNVTIGGIVISGIQTKKLVIRAKGPSLAASGVSGVMANPQMTIFSGANVIDSNDDWQNHFRAAEVPTNLQPTDLLEATIFTELSPGAYTVIVSGVGDTTGVGIVEVFEID